MRARAWDPCVGLLQNTSADPSETLPMFQALQSDKTGRLIEAGNLKVLEDLDPPVFIPLCCWLWV